MQTEGPPWRQDSTTQADSTPCPPTQALLLRRGAGTRPYLNALFNHLLRDGTSASAREIKESFVEPLAAAQRDIIENGIAAGRFRAVDPTLAYFMIVGACQ